MKISNETRKVISQIYAAYGTDSGIIFGIPADCRNAVEIIAQLIIEKWQETLNEDKENLQGIGEQVFAKKGG